MTTMDREGLAELYLFTNRDRLSNSINVTDNILRLLETRKVLLQSDVAHLKNSKVFGEQVLVHELLRILAVRENGYTNLVDVLTRDDQDDAVLLLTDGLEEEIQDFVLPSPRSEGRVVEGEDQDRRTQYDGRIEFQVGRDTTIPNSRSRNFTSRMRDLIAQFESWRAPFGDCLGLRRTLQRLQNGYDNLDGSSGSSYEPPVAQPFPVPNTKAWYYYNPNNLLGRGNTSDVFLGYWDNDSNSKVAVKYVYKNACTVSSTELGMAKEIWSSRTTKTNYVVPVLDWSEAENVYFIVMELAAATLDQAIKSNRYDILYDKKLMISLLENCVHGLHWLHEDKNCIHRDIKPHNIMLYKYDNDIVAKLGDFGICRNLRDSNGVYSLGRGTEKWMSPEALTALHNETTFLNTKNMDIFSLGMIFYYCLTGRHPFDSNNKLIVNIKDMNVAAPHLPLDDFRYASADNLLQWMMLKVPERRPNISQVRDHPMFWKEEKCLDFLEDVSRSLSNKQHGSECIEIRQKLDERYRIYYREKSGRELDWVPLVDERLFDRQSNRGGKSYDSKSLMSLVELIRDKAEHYPDIVESLRKELFDGAVYNKKAYVGYFLLIFPDIVIALFGLLCRAINFYECLGTLKNTYFTHFQANYTQCWSD